MKGDAYLSVIISKLKEVLYSVLPITIMVLILNVTLIPMEFYLIIRFIIGAVLIILGLAIFLQGVDTGITPIGNVMGMKIAKTNKIWIVITAGLMLGFLVSIAEPDLHILAGQIDAVTAGILSKFSIVVVVSIGIAVMLAIGLVRIVYNFPLYKLLLATYFVIFILAIVSSKEFLAVSFDSSGATTGALTVPFVLALAVGVSNLKKDSKASEKDSFGLIAIASTGAIISVMIMNIVTNMNQVTGELPKIKTSKEILGPFLDKFTFIVGEVLLALLPIVVIFLLFQVISFKLPLRTVRKMLIGVLYTFIGLVLFMVGVNAGFMEVGNEVGYRIAALDSKLFVVVIGFVLGLVTILAEPAVYVLTHQIEEVTSGYVPRRVVLFALSIGVGVAVALSIVRILIPALQLWHVLLPGYIISVILMFFAPKLFVAIAFDSGGVASGPMTATFILAYTQGVANAIEGANVLVDGFGMIATVAMTPIIALQILGVIFKIKSRKGD